MSLVEIWRVENLVLCVVVCAMFAAQTWHIRHELDGPRRVLCIVVVLFLLRDAEGTAENLAQGNPGGARLVFTSLLYLLILAAVVLRRVVREVGAP